MAKAKQEIFPSYIPHDKILPEVTLKGLILGILLAMILAGSNAYLGLKMGQTVSASIPAAVISMTVLRMFRKSNILENNIVQTIASAGEVVAAGIIFTIPGLIIMGFWDTFPYFELTLISIIGGVIGVFFSIPLRRAFFFEQKLIFPEGVAIAEVLKAGDVNAAKGSKSGTRELVFGGVTSALIKFGQSGLLIFGETFKSWGFMGKAVVGASLGLSPALIGAGFIVGLPVAFNMIVGGLIAWGIVVPYYTATSLPSDFGLDPGVSPFDFAMAVRGVKIKYIGVGTIVVGGLWALITLIKPIRSAIASSFEALRKVRLGQAVQTIRTEQDIPMTTVMVGTLVMFVPLFYIFYHTMTKIDLGLSQNLFWTTLGVTTVVAALIGFICSAIGGYMAGIVGSSSNPLSGITISAVLIVATTLYCLMKSQVTFSATGSAAVNAAAMVIIIAAIVAVAAAVSCDNLQDLKSGQLVGATPAKQQWTLMVGVVAGAVVVTPILRVLYEAYGIGGVFPRHGMDAAQALAAPQATMLASVAKGVFTKTMDWPMVILGAGIGVVTIIAQAFLKRIGSAMQLSVLAMALGIYLPMDVTLPMILGGVINHFAMARIRAAVARKKAASAEEVVARGEQRGVLLSSGMIAGDALVGILLAIPFAAYQSTTIMAIVSPNFEHYAMILGTAVVGALCYYLYKDVATPKGI